MRESNKNKQRKLKQCLPFAGQNKLNWEEKKTLCVFYLSHDFFLLKIVVSFFVSFNCGFLHIRESDDDDLPTPNHQKNIECKNVNNIILKKCNS